MSARGRLAGAAALPLLLLVAAGGAAQEPSPTGLEVRDRVLAGLGDELEASRAIIRLSLSAPEGAAHPESIARELVEPTRLALEADPRFSVAHVGAFAGEDLGAARAARRLGYDVLIDLVASVEARRVSVAGVLWSLGEEPSELGGLELSLTPSMQTRAHLGFPAQRADAAITARAGRLPGRDYIALAVLDLDGDGHTEIVLARDDGVHVVHVREGRVGLRIDSWGQTGWPRAVHRHPAPPRRAMATEWVGGGGVLFRLGNRATPFFVTADGEGVHALASPGPCEEEWFPYRGSCERRIPGRDFFDDEVARPGDPGRYPVGAHHYARDVRELRARDGSVTRYEALVTTRGRLLVHSRAASLEAEGPEPETHSAGAPGYGTALAIGDVDLDGEAELLASGTVADGRNDTLVVLRARPTGGLRVAWQSDPVTGAIWVAAAGDVDGDGIDELLAIEEPPGRRGRARLWVVQ